LHTQLIAPNFVFEMEKANIDSLQGYLIPQVAKTLRQITIMMNAKLLENGSNLTKSQLILMRHLENGSKPQSTLAIATDRDKGSLTRLVQSLEKKDYVKRHNCPNDSRVNMVELTSKGNEILNKTMPLVKNLFGKLQSEISSEEKEITLKVLKEIEKNAITAMAH